MDHIVYKVLGDGSNPSISHAPPLLNENTGLHIKHRALELNKGDTQQGPCGITLPDVAPTKYIVVAASETLGSAYYGKNYPATLNKGIASRSQVCSVRVPGNAA